MQDIFLLIVATTAKLNQGNSNLATLEFTGFII
jgi:hypothetical protein